ncbi:MULTISPECIES: hypothetical protein [unclassified Bradyrhizobium]|uniref:hypothetical protein n=1 Tax=unclassified Bradyrhizobium TaxID=2631580 RepID=UPI0020B43302|nr:MULTISPECIES: hypothetical protein [unclassified Bradyrhizobium]MCP3380760.1 hypothetical protein [Bradyrhizobium sp. CCGUVB4N]MCP3441633.1 hypothetical protein [Bradyrhizobium sp. CCGUVB14]
MTDVSYTVSPYSTAGSGKSCGGKHKHAHETGSATTGTSGNPFEQLLDSQANSNGTTTDALAPTSDSSQTGTGSDLGSAYQSLLATLQANGGMNDTSAAQFNDGGPAYFNGVSANQNQFADSPVNDLISKLDLDAKA